MLTNYKPLTPPPSGIIFHEVHRWHFTEPEALVASGAPSALSLLMGLKQEGVYAILTDDPTAKPRPTQYSY